MPRAGHGRDLAAAVVGQHGPSTPPTACTRAFGREANSLAHSGDSSPRLAVGTRLLAGLAGRTPKALVRQAVLLPQEPAVDDVPLVASPGLKIQERRSAVLKFKIKFQRVPSGRVRRVDGLRLQPPLPLPGDQDFRFFLFHATRPVCEPKTGPGGRAGFWCQGMHIGVHLSFRCTLRPEDAVNRTVGWLHRGLWLPPRRFLTQ